MRKISRVARKYLNTSFFHVIVQGINKEYIFKEERFKKTYLNQIYRFTEELNIDIIAYCIMDNHAHFLIMTDNIEDLSKLMQKVNSMYAKYYNYINDRVGYVFRDRFLSEPIDSKRYFIQCIKYIHLNPVKAKIVDNCKDYKYSSFSYFIEKNNYQNNKILKEILTEQEYEDICNNEEIYCKFMDIDKQILIEDEIGKFLKENKISIVEIFSDRNILKKLIRYLKEKAKMKYVDIMNGLDITKGTMERLK